MSNGERKYSITKKKPLNAIQFFRHSLFSQLYIRDACVCMRLPGDYIIYSHLVENAGITHKDTRKINQSILSQCVLNIFLAFCPFFVLFFAIYLFFSYVCLCVCVFVGVSGTQPSSAYITYTTPVNL